MQDILPSLHDGIEYRYWPPKYDDFVKSLKLPIFVIPAKAGIQLFQVVTNSLDSGFHRSDDFLRDHQI